MIEKILDLKNQNVQVDRLKEITLDELRTIKEEIRLISNKTPAFKVVEGSFKNYWGDDDKKVIGFDALWAHVNITIAKKEKEDIDDIKGYQFSNQNLPKVSKPKNSWLGAEF
jgi:hypothetical protein